MHDRESYKDSYIRAASTIAGYLAKYPTIQYVIDLHRDSLTSGDGSLIRPVTVVDGVPTAQVMCVVGSDYNGTDYSNWQDNLSLALKFRSALNEKYENISRPVYLRSSAYNQQYAPLSMLLEIGASGNSLSEAKNAAVLAAEVLADIIKGK
jgi:stage II sporulation protein P